jgi:putative FmdB family regulatory protein
MPIYKYECSQCGHCFEKLMFAGDDDRDLKCPACGTSQIRKLVSGAGTLSGNGAGLCSGAGATRFF